MRALVDFEVDENVAVEVPRRRRLGRGVVVAVLMGIIVGYFLRLKGEIREFIYPLKLPNRDQWTVMHVIYDGSALAALTSAGSSDAHVL